MSPGFRLAPKPLILANEPAEGGMVRCVRVPRAVSRVLVGNCIGLPSSHRSWQTKRSLQGRAAAGHRRRHAGRVCSSLQERAPGCDGDALTRRRIRQNAAGGRLLAFESSSSPSFWRTSLRRAKKICPPAYPPNLLRTNGLANPRSSPTPPACKTVLPWRGVFGGIPGIIPSSSHETAALGCDQPDHWNVIHL